MPELRTFQVGARYVQHQDQMFKAGREYTVDNVTTGAKNTLIESTWDPATHKRKKLYYGPKHDTVTIRRMSLSDAEVEAQARAKKARIAAQIEIGIEDWVSDRINSTATELQTVAQDAATSTRWEQSVATITIKLAQLEEAKRLKQIHDSGHPTWRAAFDAYVEFADRWLSGNGHDLGQPSSQFLQLKDNARRAVMFEVRWALRSDKFLVRFPSIV